MIPRLRPRISIGDVTAAALGTNTAEEFERAFAALMGQRDAIAFPYGRTGLLMLLEALGLKNKEIICPAYTCVVVAHAIVLSGNRPVFIDCEPGGFNMDLDLAEAAISPETGAIIATSIHGYPVDLDRLAEIRLRHPHVLIVQDCAHSFAAEHQGRPVQKEGVAAIFGFNISKLITSIFGGMVTTDDLKLSARLRALRDRRLVPSGRTRDFQRTTYLAMAALALTPPFFTWVDRIRRLGLIDKFTEYYDPDLIDMPADYLVAMSRAEASVGCRQTRIYNDIVAHRRQVAEIYDAALRGYEKLIPPPLVPGATYSHYVVRISNADRICTEMAETGVELGRVIDYCIPGMPAYKKYVKDHGVFQRTRQLNQEVVNLPLHVSGAVARHLARMLVKRIEG